MSHPKQDTASEMAGTDDVSAGSDDPPPSWADRPTRHDDVPSAAVAHEISRSVHARRRRDADGIRHTRISAAWAAVAALVVLGVALVDFVVENTRSVQIDFFSASGRIPVAVALLAAALSGAAVVLAVGICRTAQLRLSIRRRAAARRATAAADEVDHADTVGRAGH